ncbi:hypothetical protein ACOMHN_022167 [Nucella lapillus]
MRGVSKNDSLLFLYKHGKGTRRFKVKFANVKEKTGRQVCGDATVKLSALFSIHVATPPAPTHPTHPAQGSKEFDDHNSTIQQEDAPFYGVGLTSLPDDVMANHLRLFLTDPTFPAFVAKVSEQLEDIMKECQE